MQVPTLSVCVRDGEPAARWPPADIPVNHFFKRMDREFDYQVRTIFFPLLSIYAYSLI
jgi:hypothetical protein